MQPLHRFSFFEELIELNFDLSLFEKDLISSFLSQYSWKEFQAGSDLSKGLHAIYDNDHSFLKNFSPHFYDLFKSYICYATLIKVSPGDFFFKKSAKPIGPFRKILVPLSEVSNNNFIFTTKERQFLEKGVFYFLNTREYSFFSYSKDYLLLLIELDLNEIVDEIIINNLMQK
jgi:hypothetical protein